MFEREHLATVADYDVRFERKMPQQLGTKTLGRSGIANDEEASRTDVDDVVTVETSCDERRAKSAMSPDVGPAHKSNNRHG